MTGRRFNAQCPRQRFAILQLGIELRISEPRVDRSKSAAPNGTQGEASMLSLTVDRRRAGLAMLLLLLAAPIRAEIEEVVVTAQKRSEDVQDVPISISAYGGEFLERSGSDTLQDLAHYTPNLSLTHSSSVANQRIILRGVGSVGDNAIEPSVGVFIDGVYYPRPSSVVGALTDVEVVEVLRGPQGTLFGRNASMGALNIRTRNPTHDFEGTIRGSIANYDAFRVSGSVNGGITDMLAGRFAFQHSNRSGYGDNTFVTGAEGEEIGDWKDSNARGKFLFTPSDELEILLSIDYSEVENEGTIVEVQDDTVIPTYAPIISTVLSPLPPLVVGPNGPLPEMLDGGDYTVNQDHHDSADDKQWGISGDITWEVADHTVRSITAYRDWNNDTYESALRLPADLFNRVTTFEAETVSQELQLLSPTGGLLEYVAGLYYYSEDYSIDQNFDLGADFCSPAVGNLVAATTGGNGQAQQLAIGLVSASLQAAGIPDPGATLIATGLITGTITTEAQLIALGIPAPLAPIVLASASPATVGQVATGIGGAASAACLAGPQTAAIDGTFEQDLTSFAVYGQLTWNATDRLRVTGGLRWTSDEKDGSFETLINNPIVAPPSPTNPFGLQLRAPESVPDLEFDDNELTWLANVSYYVTDEIMLFGTASTGFKSGGFNSEGANRTLLRSERIFGSETVDNYEIGAKSSWFDNRMVANVTFFRTEISDFQDRQFDGVNFIVQNAGELVQQGMELDVQVQPVEQLYAILAVGYLDSEFDEFPNATNYPAVVAQTQAINRQRLAAGLPPLPVPPLDLEGERNHFSPEWQMSLSAEWTDGLPGTSLDWFARAEYQVTDDQNVGAETNGNPQTIQDGYDLANFALGLRGADGDWELTGFIRNAFDEEYCQTMFNQPIGTTLGLVDPVTLGGMQRCVLGIPQTYGVEMSYRF
jgi:iron complex outermembrane receptor protein